jgi:hypothetical protein
MVKVAGPAIRRGSINGLIKTNLNQPQRRWNQAVSKKELTQLETKLGQKPIVTYQTISRMMGYLLFKECERLWRQENPGKPFPLTAPKSSMLHIPGRPSLVPDANFVVIEEYRPRLQSIARNPKLFLGVLAVIEFFIRHGCLWSMNADTFGVTADGRVACVDLEQPAEATPAVFPYTKNQRFHAGHSAWALEELDKLGKAVRADK